VISHILDKVVISSGGIALEEVDHEVVTTFAASQETVSVELDIVVELDNIRVD
jgi:hypothetical protein